MVGVGALAFAFTGLGWVMVARFVVWVGCIGWVVMWSGLDKNMGMCVKLMMVGAWVVIVGLSWLWIWLLGP